MPAGFGQDFKNPAASPWGPEDEIGALNNLTDQTRLAALGRISSGKVYDLGVEYFKGMLGIFGLTDPRYQFWVTHSNRGFAVDDPFGVGPAGNQKILVTGDAVSMYTDTGTHIDVLNHFGLNGKIWNGFSAEEHQGDGGWPDA